MSNEWLDDVRHFERMYLSKVCRRNAEAVVPSELMSEQLTGDDLGEILEECRSYLFGIASRRFPTVLGQKIDPSDLVQGKRQPPPLLTARVP
jgi:hypothetical protein